MGKSALKPAALRASLAELAQLGSPVDLSVAGIEAENEAVEIAQFGGVDDSKIFELQDGRAACMVDIVVINHASTPIYVREVELRTSWGEDQWDWLKPEPISFQGCKKRQSVYWAYRFPGTRGLELEPDVVINHLLLPDKKLPSGCPLRGFLLGIGGLMPDELSHGQWLKPTLVIVGSDHTEYASTIELRTERLETRPRMVKPKTDLYAGAPGEEAKRLLRVTPTEPRPAPQDGLWFDPQTGMGLDHDAERSSQPPAVRDN
jgi:hypothetical protein